MAPMTAAQRQRKYREKLKRENPEKFEKLKKENAERTRKNYKKIEQLPENLKNEKRKEWRLQKQKKKLEEPKIINTEKKKKRKERYLISKENTELKARIVKMTKTIRKQNKTIYRYKKKMEELEQRLKTLEMQLQEPRNVDQNINTIIQEPTTPFSKTEKFIEETIPTIPSPEKEKVKKVIFEGLVLKESISDQYSKAETKSEKDILKNLIGNDVVKKYKLKTKLGLSCLKLKGRLRKRQTALEKKKRTIEEIKSFLERDDNSRITAGKRETKTQYKDKRQIRYLLNSLEKLHKKYKNEGGTASYTTFTRYKPFYILDPKITQRDTCACVRHANMTFLAQKLKVLGVLQTEDLDELVSTIVCDKLNEKCMYNECESCKNKMVAFDIAQKNTDMIISWHAWVTKTHEYSKNNEDNEKKTTKKTTKDVMEGTLNALIKSFSDQLLKFKKHYFNIYHAYQKYKQCKENLTETECIIHCDFSENYLCKSMVEVQATHYAGSKQQFTLHTGVIYYKTDQTLQEKSFCTISPINNHSPIAIWAHLKPVLEYIKQTLPHVTTAHFFSDGPTTQYRQKCNFYLLSNMIKKLGYQASTWTFFESAHGKGAADGIGGAVKRTLDRNVMYGEDIVDAETAYNILKKCESKIMYFYISEDNINTVEQENDLAGLIPVPHTMEIHQILTTDQVDIIRYRKLACFCKRPCECFDLKQHNLKMKTQKRKHSEGKKETSKKYSKKKRKEKPQKRTVRADSDTSIDSNITYADSDDSIWNPDVENQSYNEHDDENMHEDINETKESKINDKKITVLSEIKNTPENCKYFDLKNYGPFTLQNVDKIISRERKCKDNVAKQEQKRKSVDIDMADIRKKSEMEEDSTILKERGFSGHHSGQDARGRSKYETNKLDNITKIEKNNNFPESDKTTEEKTKMEDENIYSENKYKPEDIYNKEEKSKYDDRENKTEKMTKIIENSNYAERENKTEEITLIKENSFYDAKEKATEIVTNLHEKMEISTVIEPIDDGVNEIVMVTENKISGLKEKSELSTRITEIMDRKKDKKSEELIKPPIEIKNAEYNINDSVLVRYYEKKKWVYYVGFVTNIVMKDHETYYTICFLKTVKKPQLLFKNIKKIDKDTVPADCVVKIIHLNVFPDYYTLKDNFDDCYFH